MARRKQTRARHVPQRTCVMCRQKTDKRRLTRIVRTADVGVVADPTGKRNGRGAYLCDRPACWDQVLVDSRRLNDALKTEVSESELAVIAEHRPKAGRAEPASTISS